jgi:hypothetical protein
MLEQDRSARNTGRTRWHRSQNEATLTRAGVERRFGKVRCSAVAKLVYLTNASLDGYIEDEHGAFDLYELDDDVFAATTAPRRRG